eukprot:COSAG06_NODE_100_length_24132_cov_93.237507_4_plen_459_part_00
MRSHGRELSIYAQYYRYTGDPHGLLVKYFDRIQGRTQMLMQRRAQALRLPPSDPAYGILRGDGNEDLGGTEIGCGTAHPDGKMGDCQTELPYISITSEAWGGFTTLGAVWTEIGKAQKNQAIADAGAAMLKAAPPMLKDFHTALARGATPGRVKGTVCHPGVAGWKGCTYGDVQHYNPHPGTPYHYPTLDVFGGTHNILWSGALPEQVARDFVKFWAQSGGAFTMEAPHKAGAFTGICPFTQFGHGAGLLALDMVEEFQVFAFWLLTQAQTPGTWTAVECCGMDRNVPSGSLRPTGGGMGSGYVAPSQALMPTLIKWLCQFEDHSGVLWLGKALPRQWLTAGSPIIKLERSPSSYGRLSFSIQAGAGGIVTANVTLPTTILSGSEGPHHATIAGGGFAWPAGGIKLRMRSALFPQKKLTSVTVGGKPWAHFNATEETVLFATAPADATDLQKIAANWA